MDMMKSGGAWSWRNAGVKNPANPVHPVLSKVKGPGVSTVSSIEVEPTSGS
jgi:hypothetical protein